MFISVIYGVLLMESFYPIKKRLSMLEIKEPLKSTVLSRVEKRMAEKFEKDTNRENDGDAKRGFSTDQCIQIEAINLQKKILLNR